MGQGKPKGRVEADLAAERARCEQLELLLKSRGVPVPPVHVETSGDLDQLKAELEVLKRYKADTSVVDKRSWGTSVLVLMCLWCSFLLAPGG